MIPENQNDEIAALKNQMFILLVALIIVSGTLTAVLYRQSSTATKDIAQAEKLSAQMRANAMVIETFVTRLVAYGEKHPEFLPVLKKNGIIPPPGGAAAAPAAAPASAAPKK
jgi:hypothetical protein